MSDWIAAVAQRAQTNESTVAEILEQYNVRAAATLPRPRRMTIDRLSFRGTKAPSSGGQAFEFDLPMGPGIWCVASDEENLAGKSSVLEILLWAIRGSCHVQDDVRNWLDHVDAKGRIDNEPFAIAFDVHGGTPHGVIAIGDSKTTVAEFASHDAFKQAISDFMMDRLGFSPTPYWQSRPDGSRGAPKKRERDGDPTDLGWGGYSQALYVARAHHDAVLGKDQFGGQAGRLLQVFIGLPWASTAAAAKVAHQSRIQADRHATRRSDEDSQARAQQVKDIEDRLAAVRHELDRTVDQGKLPGQLDQALDRLQGLSAQLDDFRERSSRAQEAARAAQMVWEADQQRVLDLKETAAANRFFHGLQPTECPRCEHGIGPERRRQEALEAKCSVCGNEVEEDSDLDLVAEAEVQAQASASAVRASQATLNALTASLDTVESEWKDARDAVDSLLVQRASFSDRWSLQLEEARLQGALDERRQAAEAAIVRSPRDDLPMRILAAAVEEAEKRVAAVQGQFFDDLGKEVLRLGQAFGIRLLEHVTVNRAAHMHLVKGGAETSFSKCTEGEKLRLKIALVIALLRLGQSRGIGRHPGLLVIDSPEAQASADKDISTEIAELQRVAAELEHIQVVLSSARATTVLKALPPERVRVAPRGQSLW